MSEFMVVATGGKIFKGAREIKKIKKSLEQRVAEFEKKLQEIKLKMESQRTEKKKFFKIFSNLLKPPIDFFCFF